jgi:hypothetical protein
MSIINKTIQVDSIAWQKLKEFSKRSDIRRDPGKQAGFIIKEFFDNEIEMKEIWTGLIQDINYIIQNTQDLGKLDELYSKRESLKLALTRVGG